MVSTVLITGGTGFIGSHTAVVLQQAGYHVLIIDNLSNSSSKVIGQIEKITGVKPDFFHADIRDMAKLDRLFSYYDVKAVMHFAGLKAVDESLKHPLNYYDNNVNGSIALLQVLQRVKVPIFIFSSSATVYGEPQKLPLTETHPCSATNPYGHSKLMIEQILEYLYLSQPGWRIACLRYFNPVGAHSSALIGENPKGVPSNLMPYLAQVAVGHRSKLPIFGKDYDTSDGTGVRDYVHVMDLAQGHLAALRYCEQTSQDLITVNLGTGQRYSVLEMVRAFEQVSQKLIQYDFLERRAGDVAACWADPSLAQEKLGWRASKTLIEMCLDTWRWQQTLS